MFQCILASLQDCLTVHRSAAVLNGGKVNKVYQYRVLRCDCRQKKMHFKDNFHHRKDYNALLDPQLWQVLPCVRIQYQSSRLLEPEIEYWPSKFLDFFKILTFSASLFCCKNDSPSWKSCHFQTVKATITSLVANESPIEEDLIPWKRYTCSSKEG